MEWNGMSWCGMKRHEMEWDVIYWARMWWRIIWWNVVIWQEFGLGWMKTCKKWDACDGTYLNCRTWDWTLWNGMGWHGNKTTALASAGAHACRGTARDGRPWRGDEPWRGDANYLAVLWNGRWRHSFCVNFAKHRVRLHTCSEQTSISIAWGTMKEMEWDGKGMVEIVRNVVQVRNGMYWE